LDNSENADSPASEAPWWLPGEHYGKAAELYDQTLSEWDRFLGKEETVSHDIWKVMCGDRQRTRIAWDKSGRLTVSANGDEGNILLEEKKLSAIVFHAKQIKAIAKNGKVSLFDGPWVA